MCELPEGFVFLNEIDSSIIESIRYSTCDNLIGRVIVGYENCNRIILTKEAAIALKNVQETVNRLGYGLVVYDAYRPQCTVDSFVVWSKDPSDSLGKCDYYPFIEKANIFELGFVAEKSGHTRASTVDLTLIKLGDCVSPIVRETRMLTSGLCIPFLNDGTVDMGGSFDFMHESSCHDSVLIPEECLAMRNVLKKAMVDNNFVPYSEEWWHYTLQNEPFPNTYFNFH